MLPRFRISYSPRAIRDIQQIFTHIAEDSPENAEAMSDTILNAIAQLKYFPRRQQVFLQGSPAAETVHSLPVQPYMVYFRILGEESLVRIARIRHGARQPLKRI